jgi:ribosomal-protein-alanine N-acetyltransferase
MTRMSLSTPTLHTARLRLRPFDDADADDLGPRLCLWSLPQ